VPRRMIEGKANRGKGKGEGPERGGSDPLPASSEGSQEGKKRRRSLQVFTRGSHTGETESLREGKKEKKRSSAFSAFRQQRPKGESDCGVRSRCDRQGKKSFGKKCSLPSLVSSWTVVAVKEGRIASRKNRRQGEPSWASPHLRGTRGKRSARHTKNRPKKTSTHANAAKKKGRESTPGPHQLREKKGCGGGRHGKCNNKKRSRVTSRGAGGGRRGKAEKSAMSGRGRKIGE